MDNSSIPTRTVGAISFAFDNLVDSIFLSTLVVILLIVYFLRCFESNKALNIPMPVPWNLPLVGNFPWICWSLYRSGLPLYEFLRQLKYKYGDIYGFNIICGYLIVIVNDFHAIKELFDSPHVSHRPELPDSIKSVHRVHQGEICPTK